MTAGVVPDSVWEALPPAPETLPGGAPNALPDALARAAAHAARLPASVEGHGGDQALWHAAQEMAALGLSEADALAVLEQSFSPRCTPPWDRHALSHKVSRAVAEQQKLWDMYPPARARALAVAEAVPLSAADTPWHAPAAEGGEDYGVTWGTIEAEPAPRAYRVEAFEWGAGRPLGLLASYNASKTLTSKQILVDYALGVDVLGKYRIGERGSGKVLDLCYEQFTKAAWTYTRLARAAGERFEDLNQLVRFGRPSWFLSDGMTRPMNPELRTLTEDRLKALCEGFDICSVDPYSAASLGIDEGGSEFQMPARMLERVSEATGCAFMICVHRGRDQEAEHARGHSSIDDAFDTTILIAKHDEKAPNTRLFKCLKRPMYGFAPEVLQIEDVTQDGAPWAKTDGARESWGVRVRALGNAPKRYTDANASRVARVLEALNKYPGQWVAANKIRELGHTGMNSDAIKVALGEAEAEGLVLRREQGSGKSAYAVYCAAAAPVPAEAGPATEALSRAQSRFAGVRT